MTEKEFIDFLINLGSAIAEMFGSNCEVVINDLDNEEHAVLAIFNGHVTGREVGSPLIEDGRERVKNYADGYYINYRKPIKNRFIKSSTIEVTFNKRRFAFCINYDCTALFDLELKLKEFLTLTSPSDEEIDFSSDDVIANSIHEGIVKIGKPIHLLNKSDRLKIIEMLNEKGILKMQKSVPKVASYLGISRFTVYNYLKELKLNEEASESIS
jgi:predicted transcriptional regulator YheO